MTISERSKFERSLLYWSDVLYWGALIVTFSALSIALGVSVYLDRFSPDGVEYYLTEWISPTLFLIWAFTSVITGAWSLINDPYKRLHPLHFAPAAAYAVTGAWMAIHGFFPVNLGITYTVLFLLMLLGWFRTLTGNFQG